MTAPDPDAGELLRGRGLRSTPQRRAILAVFRGGAAEHLSADEVHAHASQALPDLSRGTVYATLAEFTETGLIAAVGTAEPVRYETNTTRHAHFRCRLCLRLFDLAAGLPGELAAPGFSVERIELRAEGICADCTDYEAGLEAGTSSMLRSGPPVDALSLAGVACAEEPGGPLGPLLLAATPEGLVRLAFEEHADAGALRARARSRRGSQAARRQLALAAEGLGRYLAGEPGAIECAIDWSALAASDPAALATTAAIPYGGTSSYSDLPLEQPARTLGRAMGANPIPLLTPCHRVTRGVELPPVFVGGGERRRWLVAHEREHAGELPSVARGARRGPRVR
ncbi:MAG: Fur family transcriptional regulator [Conexibacter sp.]|nr:Fur family transcriptional regulator [Conexibacter sp.]